MRMSSLLIAAWVGSLASCLTAAESARGTELEPAVITDEAQVLIDAMVAARRELKSGIFTAAIRHTTTDADRQQIVQATALRYVFDHPASLLRYECLGTLVMGTEPVSDDPEEVERQIKEGRYVAKPRLRTIHVYFTRNFDYSAGWFGIGHPNDDDVAYDQMSLMSPKDNGFHGFSTILNPSAVGLMEIRDLQSTENEIGVVLKRYAFRFTTVSATKLESGRVQLHYDFEFPLGRLRRTIEIDPANGFICRRMTLSKQMTLSEPSPNFLEVTADWKQRESVWIPTRTTLRTLSSSGETVEYDCILEWGEVNPAAIHPQEFDYHTFEHVWPGTNVYDQRNGKLELIEIVDERDESVEQ